MTYSSDYVIPLPLFRGRIVDQNAIHIADRSVTAIVPNPVLTDAGHYEEVLRYPFEYDAGIRQKRCGGVVFGICDRLDRQICAAIVGVETPPGSTVRQFGVFTENRYWNFDIRAGARNDISLPLNAGRNDGCGHQGDSQDS